ncbi:MAG: PilZ domain-containing protein, partial [Bdellovibrionales bacterium]|nr:PilZ domain-containing protein [Bdellovibrionales bacterium]
WCLYNSASGEELNGLTGDEVRAVVSRMTTEERLTWLVWRDDWKTWKAVTRLSDLHKLVERPLSTEPPPIPKEFRPDEEIAAIKKLYQGNQVDTGAATEVEVMSVSEIPDLAIESEGAEFVHRAHQRLRRAFSIVIDCNGQKFESKSVDVSVGGILLADPLPDWVFGYCTITIVKPGTKEAVQLTCSIVENQPPNGRFRVALSPLKKKEDQVRLHTWLSAA